MVSLFPEIKFIPCCCCGAVKLVGSRRPVGKVGKRRAFSPACPWGTALARSGGDRRSRLSTNSQRLRAIALRGLCGGWLEPAEIGLVRCSPPERLMRTPPIIPAEEFGKAALLFDAVGRRTRIDLVRGVRLAGVPLRPDRPQPELPHQPPDAPTADRNPLPRERDVQSPAAVDRMVGENPVEPLQKIEFLCGLRPGPVIEAAARNPEQRALPAYGQPRLRRDHRPPLSTREMAGCPARKSRSTCSCPIFRCRSSITFCASSTAGALLPRANSSPARFTSSCFQLLIIVGCTPNSTDSSARVFSPESAAIATRALKSALCCFLFTPTFHASLDRSAFSLSHCPKNRSRRTFKRDYRRAK